MKVLVYGAGVIGCYLTHVLCEAGNDVTLLARGSWGDTLERNGLTMVHHLQKRITRDRPRITRAPDGEAYDVVFAVMQYQQMQTILEELAHIDSPLVVLVGNNTTAVEMEQVIQAHTLKPKTVLFGFQGTGGRREAGKVFCVRWGMGHMSIGGLHSEPDADSKKLISALFQKTKYSVTWVSNMDAWYKCHLAFILPVCHLAYTLECDLTRASGGQIKRMMAAVREGYGLLSTLGYPVLPEDTLDKLEGMKGRASCWMMRVMAKTAIGRLAATDHCRHAVTEMEALDTAWEQLRAQRPDFPMPNWGALRTAMPDWAQLHRLYDGGKRKNTNGCR